MASQFPAIIAFQSVTHIDLYLTARTANRHDRFVSVTICYNKVFGARLMLLLVTVSHLASTISFQIQHARSFVSRSIFFRFLRRRIVSE